MRSNVPVDDVLGVHVLNCLDQLASVMGGYEVEAEWNASTQGGDGGNWNDDDDDWQTKPLQIPLFPHSMFNSIPKQFQLTFIQAGQCLFELDVDIVGLDWIGR